MKCPPMKLSAETMWKECWQGGWDLTLFTCTYNGSARHTVRCRLVPEENPWMEEIEVTEFMEHEDSGISGEEDDEAIDQGSDLINDLETLETE